MPPIKSTQRAAEQHSESVAHRAANEPSLEKAPAPPHARTIEHSAQLYSNISAIQHSKHAAFLETFGRANGHKATHLEPDLQAVTGPLRTALQQPHQTPQQPTDDATFWSHLTPVL